MKLEVQMVDVDHVDALRTYIRRRVRFALGRFRRSVHRVTVRVSKGRRGGVGTEAQITVRLLPAGQIVVVEQAPELHAAIGAALARLARTIERRIDSCRSIRFAGRHTEESAVRS